LRWLDRFADKMRARGLGSLFHYKTEKFIKVDVPQVEVLFRVSQALYFREAIKPQGTLVFSVTWEDTGTDAQKAE